MKYSGIYKILCVSNGAYYIGSAKNIYRRKQKHLSGLRRGLHPNPKLQAVYDKYGESDLVWSVVEEVAPDNLIIREQYYLDTLQPYINICQKADNNWLGRKHTEESKRKIGAAHKGKTLSREHLQKLSHANKGNTHNKGNKYRVGKKHSEEAKSKMSKAHQGVKLLPEQLKAFHAHIHEPASEETKKRMSEARKKWWADKKARKELC